jgi:hypothetical protein
MMNEETEQFERRLSRQPMRQIPGEWRAEILSTARVAETPRCGVGQRSALSLPTFFSTLNSQLSTIFWPHPKAWAGLAAVWVLIFCVNFSMRDTAPVVAEKSAPPSPEVIVELKQQQRMLAELIGAGQAREAEPQKWLPQPRSERVEILITSKGRHDLPVVRGRAAVRPYQDQFMDEKPKSIWKRPMNSLLACFLLSALTFIGVLSIGLIVAEKPAAVGLAGVLAGVAFFFGLAILFFRWLFNPRNFKKAVFSLVCFATLVALFYAEEDWRGWHAWNQFKHEWEAKGEKFNFTDFVPPPVPDDQNFAFAPVVASSYAMMLDKSGHEIRPRNTNVVNRLQFDLVNQVYQADAVAYGMGSDGPTNRGNWLMAQKTDLREWQNYYRWLATKTNEFAVSPQPQTPAQDVLLALSKYDLVVEDLRAAAKLPAARFPLEYDKDDPAAILLPHLAAMKRSSQFLQLRAIAELQNSQSETAFDDVKLSLRLADAIRTEPFIISHLVRLAVLQITLQPVWEGLAEHRWSDAQLAALDAELAKLDFLADYEFTVRSEPAFHIRLIDYLEQKRSRYQEFVSLFSNNNQHDADVLNNFPATAIFYLAPKGWFDQNKIALVQVRQKWDAPIVDDPQQTVSPKMVLAGKAAQSKMTYSPFNFFARLEGFLDNYAQKVARGQTAVNLARVSLALERFRLAHGEYPESLDALAPQFIAKLPHDIIGGGPLKYRRTSDGQFVLYSVGWNERDDGGVVVPTKGSTPSVDDNQADWVWRYPKF